MTTKSRKKQWAALAGKRRWSEAEARSVVEAWRASGQRAQTFAREHGLGAWKLRYWAPLIEATSRTKKTASSSRLSTPIEFVPAILTGAVSGERAAVVIRLPDGIAVEIHDAEHARPDDVGRMVASLRGVGL
ncbi:MAG: hypothetical protein JKY37_00655 [Nannocystaceae bacterium]|nr:hypothetical protein [Nannocystaceae bacterium]